MTLQESVARFESSITPIVERRVMTAKGGTALAVSRLRAQVEHVDDPADRPPPRSKGRLDPGAQKGQRRVHQE